MQAAQPAHIKTLTSGPARVAVRMQPGLKLPKRAMLMGAEAAQAPRETAKALAAKGGIHLDRKVVRLGAKRMMPKLAP